MAGDQKQGEGRAPVDVEALVKLAREAKGRADPGTGGPCRTCCSVCSPSTCADCGSCVCYGLAGNAELVGTIMGLRGDLARICEDVPTLADGVLALAEENERLREALKIATVERSVLHMRVGFAIDGDGPRTLPRADLVGDVAKLRERVEKADALLGPVQDAARALVAAESANGGYSAGPDSDRAKVDAREAVLRAVRAIGASPAEVSPTTAANGTEGGR